MEKHKIKTVMATRIYLQRVQLITKEEMESYCKGEDCQKNSVNDDLESFFEKIRLGREPDERANTYFLPKLTEEELEFSSFSVWVFHEENPDVDDETDDETEMMLSDSKYVKGFSRRKTFVIKHDSEKSFETAPENLSCFKNCCNCSLQ